ncbi:putative anti-sigma regulatory factor, serine/threonine protein kinase [Caldicellulosiruptor saccharolyticus DSM 8903]|uniref:Anti-sigma regulatory factor, serine/threonine protein kinase n=1 Tax=Caldicellulosiruptor saccharolyticus (strain ATCC 43494 / DSM 8903 / Tp8T 6331) TaxID=351627 RepID=A4XGF2_CALS8|nr:ATP-binding protein [Caldicellulosiruptor saccharolyticus]ABP65987.1 putative anti-sigma regulatory factor, serine/threonine protein kinase [Caldicellulosiruptor saccharolyticus DSM 8903]
MENKFLQLVFSSSLQLVKTIEKEILSFLMREADITAEELLEFKLIVNELLINAIIHGNKGDSSKSVKVKIGVVDKKLSYIVVEDEGEGFDIEEVFKEYTPCEENEKIEDLYEFGRGLMIVSSLCEKVKQNQRGNKIVALRRLKREEVNHF